MIVKDRFEWECQRFDALRQEYEELSEQLKTVDSEDDWEELKNHHQELMDKINEMQEELIAIVNENNQMASDHNMEYD